MSDRKESFVSKLMEWCGSGLRQFPWRKDNTSLFQVLIAEILLKQTRAETVEDVFLKLMKQVQDPADLLTLEQPELVEIIRPLGLYNHRSDALMEIARSVKEDGVPRTPKDLINLPQVGRYVANATLCFGLDQPRPIVDTNVERVYRRVFRDELEDASSEEVWRFAERVLPEEDARRFNMALLDFGAKVCTDSSPGCDSCPASSICQST